MQRRRTSPEIIAYHLGWDMREVSDCRYQPGKYNPGVYSIGDYYFCAPANGRVPPRAWNWAEVGCYYNDRKVYRAHMNDATDN